MADNSAGLDLSPAAPQEYKTFNNVVMSLKIIIIFVAIGGNILTIVAICRFKSLRYPSNMMIAALAVSDILTVTIYTPLVMIRTNKPVLFNTRASCLITIFIGQIVVVGNIVFLSLLSMERFYAVHFPYHYYEHVTMKGNFVWCVVSVVGVFLLNVPTVSGIDYWKTNGRCYSPILFPSWFTRFFISTVFTFQIIGLLSAFRVLVAELKFRRRERNFRVSDVEKQASLQSTVMVLAYSVSVCLYLPHILYYLAVTFAKNEINYVLFEILLVLDLCNPAINLFIYGFKSRKFREAYKSILRCKGLQVEPLTTTEG
ncbi:trace amine-associated receptor 2-like [Gigantopelta aegis]|uniref:trace amine-associated receptor 2-like n=1 Tax=Gigantopelta aegis TaxID=1735272 RepID=UPI001B88A4A6|nr:trace amine-associated receptor 2-like [Gigantopelta aegis]